MTPEEAAYHRLMLLAGLEDRYALALDQALEEEEPLSELVLELASCMSDMRETVSVLYRYTQNHPADERQVCDLVLADFRERFLGGELTRDQIVTAMYEMVQKAGLRCLEPWEDLIFLTYEREAFENHMISESVFNAVFDVFLLRGERLDGWKMQNALQSRLEKPQHSAAYRRNVGLCAACVVLSFGAIFAAAALTGWRDFGDFSGRDWRIWAVFLAAEVLIVALEFFFGSRAGKLWRQRSETQQNILQKFKTVGLDAYSRYDRVYYEAYGARRAVAFQTDNNYAVTVEHFDFDNLCWHVIDHEEPLESLAAVEEFLRENQDFQPEDGEHVK